MWVKIRFLECFWGVFLFMCIFENGSLGIFYMVYGIGDWYSELDGSINIFGGVEVSVVEG